MGAQPLRFSLAHDSSSSPTALDSERRDEIRDRLESGFYRQPDVLLETAARLLADLMSDNPFGGLAGPEESDQRER